jgi:putative ABC transport system permease protein
VRVLWVKAPFVLRRHPPVLLAVILMSALAALAAAATPIVRAGVQSESLKRQLRDLTPLSTGLQVMTGGPVRRGAARRRAAEALPARVRFLGPPVESSLIDAQLAGSSTPGLGVAPLTRTGAVAHVEHVRGGRGAGVWIADSTARSHLAVGDTLRLTRQSTFYEQHPSVAAVRIAGIYRALEGDRDNPYWANWQHEIRPLDPDDDPPPPFVLMDRATFDRVAAKLSLSSVQDRFEFPIDPAHITYTSAQELDRRLTALRAEIERPGSPLARALECNPSCHTSSSLSAALTIAAGDVAAVGPTIFLLSACGLLIALGLSVAAGLFLVRRRGDEAHVLFARGESPVAFGARTALESVLPTLAGLAIGLGTALLTLRALAPAGTVNRGTVTAAAARASLACVAAIACVAAGAGFAFPRRGGAGHGHRWHTVPWEVVPLVAGAALLTVVLAGHGLTHDETGATHPRLVVFVLPVLIVAGAAGVCVRILRRALRGRRAGPAVVFLALRRLATARGLLVGVIVASATAFGAFAYATTLSASLERSTDEKAFVSNGSDVQGFIDPANSVVEQLAFPVAVVEVDQENISLASGGRVDLIAGDPEAMRRTIRWGDGWGDDPRPLLPRIAPADGRTLLALATPGAPNADAIVDQGVRIPIRIVGRAPFPGTSAGRPAIVVSRAALRRVAARLHILDPAPLSTGLLWAKGSPAQLMPVLQSSSIAPVYMTSLGHIRKNASVSAAARSYRYVRLIAAAAAVLSLVALLLYLQARQRSLLIASALVRRMGLGALSDAAAVALEAAVIVLFAALAGGLVAVAAARPITRRLDSLPQYAPAPVYVAPWHVLAAAVAAATLVAAVCGALATVIAQRSDVSEALRVA